MSASQLLFMLIGLFMALFVVALLKPKLTKAPLTIHALKDELAKHLPHHALMVKDGTPARIIVSQNGTQQAIVVMGTPKDSYEMGGVVIFTTNKRSKIKHIAHQIASIA